AKAQAADEWRIRQLMQDINELKSTVREQARRLDQLERAIAPREPTPTRPPKSEHGLPTLPPTYGSASLQKWQRVEPGMTERQVIDILGYPTSVRTEPESLIKTLFYTVQIGPSGFLSGRIVLAAGQVRDVEQPTLK